LTDDGTDDCARGADDVAVYGPKFRKLRFQMIADTNRVDIESTKENQPVPAFTSLDSLMRLFTIKEAADALRIPISWLNLGLTQKQLHRLGEIV
jgi:hypothetical protein